MKLIYEQFIEYLKQEEKKLDLNTKNLEKHHIVPLHAGGKKDDEIVLCTSKNHTSAHYYRYFVYNELGDFVAFKMRNGTNMSIQERSLLGIKKMKENKLNFFDPNWQSIQGSKKKKVKKTKKQIESRKKTGYNNRKSILKIVLTKTTLWKYCYKDNNINKILYKKIEPQKSFQDIICILQTFSSTLDNTKTFDKSL